MNILAIANNLFGKQYHPRRDESLDQVEPITFERGMLVQHVDGDYAVILDIVDVATTMLHVDDFATAGIETAIMLKFKDGVIALAAPYLLEVA